MGEIYIKGLYRTCYIARFMNVPISEYQVDAIKESISRYWERKKDSLPLPYQEKDEQKRQMKHSVDAYNHGIKDALKVMQKLT